jgi:hypothetical protein
MYRMTDEELINAIAALRISGEHTSGGDSLLFEKDRGLLNGWQPDEGWQFDLDDVREFMTIYRDEEEPLKLAIASLAGRLWELWVASTRPDLPMCAIQDVCFRAE